MSDEIYKYKKYKQKYKHYGGSVFREDNSSVVRGSIKANERLLTRIENKINERYDSQIQLTNFIEAVDNDAVQESDIPEYLQHFPGLINNVDAEDEEAWVNRLVYVAERGIENISFQIEDLNVARDGVVKRLDNLRKKLAKINVKEVGVYKDSEVKVGNY